MNSMQLLHFFVKQAMIHAQSRGTTLEHFGVETNLANKLKEEYGVVPKEVLGIKLYIDPELDEIRKNIDKI